MNKLEYVIDFIRQKNGKEFAKLKLKGMFPDYKFKADTVEGVFSLHDLKELLHAEGFEKEETLTLTITNRNTDKEQKSVIDFSENWPQDLSEHPAQSREGSIKIEV